MTDVLLILVLLSAIVAVSLLFLLLKRMKAGGDKGEENIIRVLREESIQLQRAFKDDTGRIMSQIKEDMHLQQKELRESLAASFSEFRVTFDKNNELVNKIINA